ncbi:MAG: type II toxin-antitoxin system Phd/YefM family antitoxin, partial [Rhodospirillaceae bacterium]|nr:type II toxin-antitoxin system Phd/YefM family antitoxin [Rhodospirillaceae bacterium]
LVTFKGLRTGENRHRNQRDFHHAVLSLSARQTNSGRISRTMIFDHDTIRCMEQIKISEFKATCLAVLARVQHTGKPVLVTRFGKPVAQVIPLSKASPDSWLDAMRGRGAIVGDLIEPVSGPEEWEAFQPGPGASDK